ncbi:RNA-binding RNA processing protein rpp1 [Rhizina undulata]
MFYDLNIPWSQNSPELPRIAAFLDELGYNVIALNHTLSGKLSPSLTNPIPADPFPQTPKLRVLRRITLVLDDPSQNHRLASLTNLYDIVALRPTSEKLLLQACSALECDLVSLDLSQRLPFHLKHKVVGTAIQRGIFFEITYSASITDVNARRNLISNAAALIRATRGRGIIISSEAKKAVGLRAPFDIINLATLWGLSQEKGREAIGSLSRSVVAQAEMRRRSFRGVINVVESGGLSESERLKKRKAEDEAIEGNSSASNPSNKGKQKQKQQIQPQIQGGGKKQSKKAKKAAAAASAGGNS